MTGRCRWITMLAALLPVLPAAAADAVKDYPNRPIRLITGSPGSTADFAARFISQKLGERWKQQVVVDNRPGGGGIIGSEIVARSVPDGYTLIVSGISIQASAQFLYKKLPFDPEKDFVPITNLLNSGVVLTVHPTVPAANLKEFIAHAKAKSGGVLYATSVPGSSSHLTGELFNQLTGAGLRHVPYKGAGYSLTALMANEVQAAFLSTTTAGQQVRIGRLRALALLSANRFAPMPDVPTAAEQGFSGMESYVWFGLYAPAKLPRALVERINRDVVAILRLPETVSAVHAQGAEPAPMSPEEFAAFNRSEIAKWGKVIRQGKITLD